MPLGTDQSQTDHRFMNATVPTDETVSDEMAIDGFLSPTLHDYIPNIIEAHPAWFDFARRLNRRIVSMWLQHPITTEGLLPLDPEPLAVRLMARAMDSFQGAVLLLERGMTVEAGTLARNVYETGFWLAYIREHPKAATKQFKVEELEAKISRHNGYKEMFAHNAERLTEIEATLVKLRRQREGSKKTDKLQIPTLAERGKSKDFYIYYKVLCGSSAHASVLSTDHYLNFFDDETAGHTIGPDIEGIDRKLAFACHAVLLSAIAFAGFTEADACGDLLTLTEEFFNRSSRFEFGTLD